jgi:SprA family protein
MTPAYAMGGARASARANDRKVGPADESGRNAEASRTGQIRDELRISPDAELRLIGQLSEAEQRTVAKLKARDREVRAHEQAHLSAAGPHASGGPRYQYQKGPDNARYAVGGEVDIDVSPVAGDPEATIRKAQVIRAAALAPSNPSPQDHQVAAAATKMEAEARQKLSQQQTGQPQSRSANPNIGALFDAVA